jgi:hypothetical protein
LHKVCTFIVDKTLLKYKIFLKAQKQFLFLYYIIILFSNRKPPQKKKKKKPSKTRKQTESDHFILGDCIFYWFSIGNANTM